MGTPVLLVVDVQKGCFMPLTPSSGIWFMPDMAERMHRVRAVVDAARDAGIAIIFLQEAHRRDMVDFGRELDGTEHVHCLEGDPGTPVAIEEMGVRPDDYIITKRRYSGFFGTDLSILLRGLRADTLILTGGLTDVCVHYTFVDGHQNDYYCRVVEDCVAGSTLRAHTASLEAMEYLQTGARRMSSDVISAFRSRILVAA